MKKHSMTPVCGIISGTRFQLVTFLVNDFEIRWSSDLPDSSSALLFPGVTSILNLLHNSEIFGNLIQTLAAIKFQRCKKLRCYVFHLFHSIHQGI